LREKVKVRGAIARSEIAERSVGLREQRRFDLAGAARTPVVTADAARYARGICAARAAGEKNLAV